MLAHEHLSEAEQWLGHAKEWFRDESVVSAAEAQAAATIGIGHALASVAAALAGSEQAATNVVDDLIDIPARPLVDLPGVGVVVPESDGAS